MFLATGESMFLLAEKQIDRTQTYAPLAVLAPMLFVVPFKLLLPHGLLIGVLTLYGLFTLGVCGLAFQKWRTDSGLWMVVVLMLCSFFSVLLLLELESRAGWVSLT